MKLFYCVYTLAVALTVSCKRKCSNFVPKPNKDLWLHGKVPLKGEPAYEYRILDHWDNLDDTVERGYAGNSIFGWTLDEVPKERIVKYARLNPKIGIDGAVIVFEILFFPKIDLGFASVSSGAGRGGGDPPPAV